MQTQTGGQAEGRRVALFCQISVSAPIIALAAIYVILALVFQNWTQPLLVMAIIPFGLYRSRPRSLDCSVSSFLPFSDDRIAGLSGILVNGSIVLVDRYNERVRHGEGA